MVKHDAVNDNPDAESEQARRLNDKLRRELGDVILAQLDDPAVTEIMLNPDGVLWSDRRGAGMCPIGTMTRSRAMNLIGTVAGMLGVEARAETPFVQGELPLDGSRFQAEIPPVVTRPAFNIRKKAIQIHTLADYVRDGIMSQSQLQAIEGHIRLRHNILVVGGTGTGKTTLCNALMCAIVESDPNARFIIIEDTRELQCPADNKVEMRTSEFVDMNQILANALRMRPDRIVVGEVRNHVANTLLKAWNTGHSGGVATVHANSAPAGLVRIEQLVQEANVPPQPSFIAEAINCIVSIQMTTQGRRIEQIVTVKGGSASGYDLEIL